MKQKMPKVVVKHKNRTHLHDMRTWSDREPLVFFKS